MSGTLYIVATPIGNLGDLTPRAAETFAKADFIAAEDTRVTLKLLNHLGLKKPMVSYYEHNLKERGGYILDRIEAGESCALCSDAGMPAVSDPGASAAVTALCVSGQPTGRFVFEGFLPTNRRQKKERLAALQNEERTVIFYEAPHKLPTTLQDLEQAFGPERSLTICRELTKLHEQTLRTTLDGAVAYFTENAPKGEFVLVLRGAPERSEPEVTAEQALEIVARYRSEGRALKEACKLAAADTGFGKNELYQMALNI